MKNVTVKKDKNLYSIDTVSIAQHKNEGKTLLHSSQFCDEIPT